MSGPDELDEALALANDPARRRDPAARPGSPAGAPGASAHARGGCHDGPDGGEAHRRRQGDGDDLDAPEWLTPAAPSASPAPSASAARGPSQQTGGTRRQAHGGGDDDHAHDLPWPDARTYAARVAGPVPSCALPLGQALNHTLDAPLDALTDLPSFDTSAMDGWAVSGPGPWELAEGERPDGHGLLAGDRRRPRTLPDGRAVRIATGARVPPGASAVLRYEYGEFDGTRLRAANGPQPGADIRPRGQECRSGDRLLPTGTAVTPAVLGLAAAAGYDRLTVTRRPRAEVLVLGDELLHLGVPREGRIRDALGPMVEPWLTALGADVLVTRRLGDDAEALHEAVATTTADVLVTTGGTARGPVDHLRPTLARAGARLLVEGVRVRPGHPMLLARLPAGHGSRHPDGSGPYLVGLPGNPLAALSGLMTLAAPLIRTLADRPPEQPPSASLSDEVQGHPRDTRLVPVSYAPERSRARPLLYNGPAMLRGIATATALAVVPPGGAKAGTCVPVLPLPWHGW